MLIFAARYNFLFWLLISSNNVDNILVRHMQDGDESVYKLAACTAACLMHRRQSHRRAQPSPALLPEQDNDASTMFLQRCYDVCRGRNATADRLHNIENHFYLRLVCRDDRSLTFRIDRKTTPERTNIATAIQPMMASEDIVFIIKVHLSKEPQQYLVYLSDETFFTLANLKSNTMHNVSVAAVHANKDYYVIATGQQYATLKRGYTPGSVHDIQVQNFTVVNDLMPTITATITWKPATDLTCLYEIICFSPDNPDYDIRPMEIRNQRDLYAYELRNLSFSSVYKVGVRARHPNNKLKESSLFWKTFSVPTCLEWYNNNYSLCAPPEPIGLQIEQIVVGHVNEFSLNVTWQRPNHFPDFYILKVIELHESIIKYFVNVSGETTSVFIPWITLNGMIYEVALIACTAGGNATARVTDFIKMVVVLPDKYDFVKFIGIPFIGMVTLLMMIVSIWRYTRKKKNYQEHCEYLEEIENNDDDIIHPKARIQITSNPSKCSPLACPPHGPPIMDQFLSLNDGLEVERTDVVLHEILGEGAFGLVRRGTYCEKDAKPQDVAVKMLKDQPSVDEVKAFCHEIKVMKSVEAHHNILSIIGHCTRNSKDVLLLMEYCSRGSLLDLLRDEWRYIQQCKCKSSNTTDTTDATSCDEGGGPMNQQRYGRLDLMNGPERMHPQQSSARRGTATMKPPHVADNECYGYNEEDEDESADGMPSGSHREEHCLSSRLQPQSQSMASNYFKGKRLQRGEASCERRPDDDSMTSRPCHDYDAKNSCKHITMKSSIRDNDEDESDINDVCNVPTDGRRPLERTSLMAADLLSIAKQVATGMEFLAKNKIVHRDLAARNVLVTSDRTIKIADFGLSRDIYQENIYKKAGNGKLPVKWLALESMTHQVYTTQSDVWSFGILLYEIVTLGGIPYPAIPINRLLPMLKSGYRLEKPKNCGQEFYNLMSSCWKSNPNQRPTFNHIVKTLDVLRNFESIRLPGVKS